jgi:hypothetical protein
VRFKVLTAVSMEFRFVFWDVLPCKIIVDNYFTLQYIPEDKSELHLRSSQDSHYGTSDGRKLKYENGKYSNDMSSLLRFMEIRLYVPSY